MDDIFDLTVQHAGAVGLAAVLEELNAVTGQFGLTLTESQLQAIARRRLDALGSAGRIEFGQGIVKKLIVEFCDSPYIDQANYEETILELLDSFYYFKNESEDLISDDELIALMRRYFDTVCQGSLEYLTGTTLAELCRKTRNGFDIDGYSDEDDDDIDAHWPY